MNEKKYLKDITDIKSLMTESSRFLYFTTGLSSLTSGAYALIGTLYIYLTITNQDGDISNIDSHFKYTIAITLFIVLMISVITTLLLTTRKSKKSNKKAWNEISKKLLFNFFSFLIVGGVYVLILFFQERYHQIVPLMLIFYGLALLNGSKYTFKEVRVLGYVQVFLGFSSSLISDFDFWFWVLGFGVVHIIYGSIMYFKYGK